MKLKTFSLYASTGIFIIVGLVCIAYLTLTPADSTIFSGGYYTLTAKFTNVSGLNPGSNVEISGVAVGKVTDISLESQLYHAVVTMQILDSVPIPVDSTATIKTSGLIGDKYVGIIPGGDDVNLKDDEAILDTQPALDIEELVSKYVFGSVDE